MAEIDDIGNLLQIKKQRLTKLQEQRAYFGYNTPPHILMELDDIKADIDQLTIRAQAIRGVGQHQFTVGQMFGEETRPFNARAELLEQQLFALTDELLGVQAKHEIVANRMDQLEKEVQRLGNEITSLRTQPNDHGKKPGILSRVVPNVMTKLGVRQAFFIVGDGRIMIARPPMSHSVSNKSRLVIIQPWSAVVFEMLGEFRIVAAGATSMRRQERIRAIVDLKPQTDKIEADSVTTLDGIRLVVNTSYGYKIESDSDREQRIVRLAESQLPTICHGKLEAPHGYSRDPIARAAYHSGREGWRAMTADATTHAVHETLSQHRSVEILETSVADTVDNPLSVNPAIINKVEHLAWQRCAQWGVRVQDICVDVTIPLSRLKANLSQTENK